MSFTTYVHLSMLSVYSSFALGWMAPVRKTISSRHPSDRFSKKHIRNEDGSVLVVSKKMKNIIKQDLKAQSITNMLTDDPNSEVSNFGFIP